MVIRVKERQACIHSILLAWVQVVLLCVKPAYVTVSDKSELPPIFNKTFANFGV